MDRSRLGQRLGNWRHSGRPTARYAIEGVDPEWGEYDPPGAGGPLTVLAQAPDGVWQVAVSDDPEPPQVFDDEGLACEFFFRLVTGGR